MAVSALKTQALTVLAWGALASLAQAEPITPFWHWTAWVAGTGVRQGTSIPVSPTSGTNEPAPPPISIMSSTPTIPPPSPPPSTSSTPPTGHPDAYLNFGTSSYPEQSVLTVGTAQPWYDSTAVTQAFGHTPTPQEQQGFINGVVSDVQHTFEASGLTGSNGVTLTTDPNAGANHTLSIVSGLSYSPNPGAIGITDVGGNGFSFIDKLNYANNPQDLEWADAHNIAHELMHAFGVAVHHDQTGDYLDAASASWSLLINPNATLSQAAVNDILAHNIGRNGNVASAGLGGEQIDGDQELLAPVPEPTTIACWGLTGSALFLWRRRAA